MATYDLAYPGAAIDAILNTAYYLQEAGYIFQGSASEYSGTPSKRVWLIAPAGFTGLGLSSAVPKGSIGVCLYNGTAWVGKVINVLTLDSEPTRNSQNGVTSGGVAATLDAIAGGIMETFASLLFDDETASADLRTKLSYAVKFSVSDVYQTVTHLNILAATTSKAGLMSAEDKAKVDSFLTGIRSMQFVDATSSSEQAIKLVEQLKWTVGGVQEVIDSITLLAATSSKAGLLSASDKAYIDALPATLTSLSISISGALALMKSLVGYYVCDTAAGTAAKTVDATGYSLTNGGCIRIKMTNANTANNATLNINSTGAKALYYDGAQASSTNTWEAGEVLEVYYDGTQYQCASSGGGRAYMVKYDNTGSGLSADNVQDAIDEIADDVEQLNNDIYGVPTQKIGTWGSWVYSSSNPKRCYIICNQKSIAGGIINVRLNDYSTYKCGCGLYAGTAWSSTQISDTGWQTADTTKVIQSNQGGFYIRISLGRVDNASMTLEEVVTAIKSFSYVYYKGSAGIMQSIDDLYARNGYYICDTADGTAAKTVSATGYEMNIGGCIRIKMTNANTASNVTLNINGTGAKALFYNGVKASPTNSWEEGEVLEIYYDGTQYQCQGVSPAILETVRQLDYDVYGSTSEITADWGDWKSSNTNPQRIYVICNDKTVLGGIVNVKLNNYNTYKTGIVIQNGTGWITSGAIFDDGWHTADCTHVITENEVGYNIRVSIASNDNGAISPSEAQNIISLLEYKYDGRGTSIMSRLEDLENAELNLPKTIPMEVLPGAFYVGEKMDLGSHSFSSEVIGSFANAGNYVQGAAVFGDYLFQFHNTNNAVIIIKLSTGQTVQTIQFTPNANCHCNTASFGSQYYDTNDPFPCVYVSSEGEKKVYVYRITGTEGNYAMTVVQELSHSLPYYYPNISIDAPNNRGIAVGYKNNSWQNPEGNAMLCCCFDLPDVKAGNKSLENPYNEFAFPFIYAQQTAFGKYGKLYHAFGNTSQGLRIGGIVVIDYILHNVITFVDLHTVGDFELEGLGEWDGGLVITTQGRQIIKLTF